MRVRHLHLRVSTNKGLYGTRLEFKDGLNLIRADNNMGKSTCIQAMIYALGLERMLGPSSVVPLPHAMTQYLSDSEGDVQVLESEVLMEIIGADDQVLTIQRSVIGQRDSKLISVWHGPKLSDPSQSFDQRDFFVRDPGAAIREAGFHTFLADFLGWTLPQVARYSGLECPLYLEVIFPLFFVEQKHGWSGIQANVPTYFGIREVAKRACEFAMHLDAAALVEERQRLRQEEDRIRSQWKSLRSALSASLRMIHSRVTAIPELPTSQWPPAIEPEMQIYRAGAWMKFDEALVSDKQELAEIEENPPPTVGVIVPDLQIQLEKATTSLREKEVLAGILASDIESERAQVQAIQVRISALDEDLRRNQDALKLRALGSVSDWQVNKQVCPTCHQQLSDLLLPQPSNVEPMTLYESVQFISEQLRTFKRLLENSTKLVSTKDEELASVRDELSTLRSQIRAIKQSLLSVGSSPSIEDVRRRIQLDTEIRSMNKAREEFDEFLSLIAELVDQWREAQHQIKLLPADNLSTLDKSKLSGIESILQTQLSEYGFSSHRPGSINISNESYLPAKEGFNLGFDISASDNIRLIWSYLLGLLELSCQFDTNHPGLLIFDEPRQQEAANMSFQKLLQRASLTLPRKQQVIFATSQARADLTELVQDSDVNLIDFDGRMISRLN